MGKKCVIVMHRGQTYKIFCEDITKIIFKQPSNFPPVPIYQSSSKKVSPWRNSDKSVESKNDKTLWKVR